MRGALLLTWILFGTVTTVQCQGTVCVPTRGSTAVAGLHRLAVFPDPQQCHAYRVMFTQQPQPVVHSQAHPPITIRKQITYTCQRGEEP